MEPALPPLSPAERGLVLGLALGGARPAVAARVGAACAEALEVLLGAAPEARAAALVGLAAAVRAPLPAGIERVHPGWIRRLLADEPAAVVRAVTAGLPAPVAGVADELLGERGADAERAPSRPPRPEAVDELRRLLFGALVPMPPDGPRARALCELPAPALVEAIDRKGAALLGVSLHGAPAPTVARAAAGLGEPLGGVVVAAAKEPAAAGARAAARELAARLGADAAALGVARALGLRAVIAEVRPEGPEALAAVAQRLPPAVGDALLAVAGEEGAGHG